MVAEDDIAAHEQTLQANGWACLFGGLLLCAASHGLGRLVLRQYPRRRLAPDEEGCCRPVRLWAPLVYLLAHMGGIYFILAAFALGPLAQASSAVALLMTLFSLMRTVSTNPGSVQEVVQNEAARPAPIANGLPQLDTSLLQASDGPAVHYLERKGSGARRYCKYCGRMKPDRAHHCKVCRCCVLRMDHHCPWLNSCVGLRNYRFFLLALGYGTVTLLIVATAGLGQALVIAWRCQAPLVQRLALMWASWCMLLDSLPLLMFALFHLWISSNGATTIEYCEKGMGKDVDYIYSRGSCWANWHELGQSAAEWLCPVRPPKLPRMGLTEGDRFFSFSELSVGATPTAASAAVAAAVAAVPARPLAATPSRRPFMVRMPTRAVENATRSTLVSLLTTEWGLTTPRVFESGTLDSS